MKTTVYYTANRTMEIDLPDKYNEILTLKDEKFNDAEDALVTEVIDYIDNYIRQIDPDFCESCGMTGKNVEWEW